MTLQLINPPDLPSLLRRWHQAARARMRSAVDAPLDRHPARRDRTDCVFSVTFRDLADRALGRAA